MYVVGVGVKWTEPSSWTLTGTPGRADGWLTSPVVESTAVPHLLEAVRGSRLGGGPTATTNKSGHHCPLERWSPDSLVPAFFGRTEDTTSGRRVRSTNPPPVCVSSDRRQDRERPVLHVRRVISVELLSRRGDRSHHPASRPLTSLGEVLQDRLLLVRGELQGLGHPRHLVVVLDRLPGPLLDTLHDLRHVVGVEERRHRIAGLGLDEREVALFRLSRPAHGALLQATAQVDCAHQILRDRHAVAADLHHDARGDGVRTVADLAVGQDEASEHGRVVRALLPGER